MGEAKEEEGDEIEKQNRKEWGDGDDKDWPKPGS